MPPTPAVMLITVVCDVDGHHAHTKIRGFPAARCGCGGVRVPPGTEPRLDRTTGAEESVYTLSPCTHAHTHTHTHTHTAKSGSCPPLLLHIIYQSISGCLRISENPPSLPQPTHSLYLPHTHTHTHTHTPRMVMKDGTSPVSS